MKFCPKCGNNILEIVDRSSGFKQRVCQMCLHYESDSPAFAESPDMFQGLGCEILAKIREEADSLANHGLTILEAEAWLVSEQSFPRNIVCDQTSGCHPSTRRSPRDKLTPYLEGGPGSESTQYIAPPVPRRSSAYAPSECAVASKGRRRLCFSADA